MAGVLAVVVCSVDCVKTCASLGVCVEIGDMMGVTFGAVKFQYFVFKMTVIVLQLGYYARFCRQNFEIVNMIYYS